MKFILQFVALSALLCSSAHAAPLKVFILAGQSNMEGPAKIETFDYIGDDPATAPLLKRMRDADGKPAVCDGAWISYLTGDKESNFVLNGKLTAGFGSLFRADRTKPGGKIGPEFTFGLTMDAAFVEPVLLIKAAWGGKSLHTDFRPPGSGPYVFKDTEIANMKKKGQDIAAEKAAKVAKTGVYYRHLVEHVKSVLADPKRVCPAYDPAQGYEIAGFAWLQGFNDLVDSNVYPHRDQPGGYAAYSEVMAQLIRDVRKDLAAPKMPFVIGVLGVDGLKANPRTLEFRRAMAAPAALPEFKGNVIAVETAPFWSEELGAIDEKRAKLRQMRQWLDSKHKAHANADGKMTEAQKREHIKKLEAEIISPAEAALWERGASNQGYHYLGCAKTFALMGQAFAAALLKTHEPAK